MNPFPILPLDRRQDSKLCYKLDRTQFLEEGRQDIELLYQPIIDLKKKKVARVEALVRFLDDGEMTSPDKVLPFLSSEEIIQVNFAVLKRASQDIRRWQRQGLSVQVSVNIEIFQLEDPNFAQRVLRILKNENVSPRSLSFEILEGNDQEISSQMLRQINELRQEQITFALDDIGSAYSGLARIRDLPIDALKLDKDFVSAIHENPQHLKFIQALSALSHSLDKKFIVEGVEDFTVLNALRRLGVSLIQGYVFSKPIPADQIPLYLCDLSIPPHSNTLRSNDWLGAYAEILRERERLIAMTHHAPEMLNPKIIHQISNTVMESCLLMAPHIYNLYYQLRSLISHAAAFQESIKNDDLIEKIEQGYRELLMAIENKMCEEIYDKHRTQ
ncbi:MAG: EAL domain-containing protein [Acidithiobacillus sp.]